MTKITFIRHDCFAAETPQAVFIFDYWVDTDGRPKEFPSFLDDIPDDRPLYVLVSHGHKDHYNPSVFAWASRFANIRYVVSNDVWRRIRHIVSPTAVYSGPKVDAGLVTVLRPGERFSDIDVEIIAFPSTDTGNSYMAVSGGVRIFHAGDLNAWQKSEAPTEEETRASRREYMEIVDEIAGIYPNIDLAMFPVDSRLGTEYYEGARIFVRKFDVGIFVPMHFELVVDDEDKMKRNMDAGRFELYSNPTRGEYIHLASSRSKLRKNFEKP